MVAVKEKIPHLSDGSVDIATWLQNMTNRHHLKETDFILKACQLADTTSKGLTTFYGKPCIEKSLEMAEIIFELKLDQESIIAAIISNVAKHTNLTLEKITQELGTNIAQLVSGVLQMDVINNLAKAGDHTQIDRLRKTLLAMASDIRVVIIKLAERTCLMRGIKHINSVERKRLAQETMDIYAPLANRLGIGQLKWELEDFAFHYINPETYKTIATFLAERRADREKRIHETIARLKEQLEKSNIAAHVSGRAKHIYSIFLKMRGKDIDLKNIYDFSAVRIIVPHLDDCYTALSITHGLWEHIKEEFDDYISNPKPNGYRSIHTAVIGPDGKNLEIQIRTRQMHDEAEHGIAAHWIYKEKKSHQSGYETKITFLRQLLAWHKEVAEEKSTPDKINTPILEDRVYVFTPAGDILDLSIGATPLDFAYHVHSQLGHRCRGAKVNHHIVPLTYALQTGDQVEIITTQHGTPSRDWLNKEFGYIKTSRARAKVAQWFRQQEVTQYIESGKNVLEKEFARAGIHQVNLQKIATRFNFKDDDSFFAAIGHGVLRMPQIIQAAHAVQKQESEKNVSLPSLAKKTPKHSPGLRIEGASDLLTRIAKCCKPIPGDPIIGYITQGRGVSIHRQNCSNISINDIQQQHRILDVSWDNKQLGIYYVELQIQAYDRVNLLKEITALLSHLKIDLITFHSTQNKNNNMILSTITIQIHDLSQLQQLLNQIKQLPNILDVKRLRE